ncbi:MutS-related protein [Acidiphilium sp.]|uniref:MutS-related protein n=1 Tax=Acidiphilium sp. TaxID=527 RepID=UPI00258D9072|nr:DNA mismatch repair protein MutS [Acidiphilium sp.]
MKAHLLFPDRDLDATPLPENQDALTLDLGLDPLLNAMAGADGVIRDVARRAILNNLTDQNTIAYRQDVLRDTLAQRDVVREIYTLAGETIERERKNYFGFISRSPEIILHRSVEVMAMFVEQLKRLRGLADRHAPAFQSSGFKAFFATLMRDLDDAYFIELHAHIVQLRFKHGTLISAELGNALKGNDYVLRRPNQGNGWLSRLLGHAPPSESFTLHPRDEAGARALSEINSRGVNLVANAAAQANDHILSFFRMVQREMAFYVGCLALEEALVARGQPVCFPETAPAEARVLHFSGLYDVSLALTKPEPVIGNDGALDGKEVIVVTGANQGGKSTFLRSLGLAQMMMQAGMFVGAHAFAANLCQGVETHYKREEDASMTSGKFDEELARMSALIDRLRPGALVLCNESFQSTNEREGSAIARELVFAFQAHRIKTVFVTHLYDLAHGLHARGDSAMAFLRAERDADGTRSFHVVPGEPLSTSFGEDLYHRIFAAAAVI